jgi:hypothetical protein
MTSQKEKIVLERQKQLAAAMAAKRRQNKTPAFFTSTNQPPSSFSSSMNNPSSSSTDATPAIIKAGGLTISKKQSLRQQHYARPPVPAVVKPMNSTRSSTHQTGAGSSARVTSSSSSTSSDKKILGIHKSFKRPSPAAAVALARAKALQEKGGNEEPPSKKSKTAVETSSLSSTSLEKVSRKVDAEKSGASNNRLKNLVENVVAQKEDQIDSAALGVNITPEDFWKNIRNWDFFSDLAKQQLEESGKTAYMQVTRRPVPDTFINTRHYVAIWSPLCLDECRSQLLSEFSTDSGQMNPSPFILVDVDTTWKTGHRHDSNIHSELTDISDSCKVMIKTKNRGDGSKMQFLPHDICCLVTVEKKDLVESLLRGQQRSNNSNKMNDHTSNGQDDAFQNACLVGHTVVHRNSLNGLILQVSKRKWAKVGMKEMYLVRIGSNVTALREYTALCNVHVTPLNKYLLGQRLAESKRASYVGQSRQLLRNIDISDPNHKLELLKNMGGVEALGKGFTQYINRKFNPSQLMAISASSEGYGDGGFTLIKGPPGTCS